MIRGYPNGTTRHSEAVSSHLYERRTWGTETSKYPQEKKTKVIAQVVASERAVAQTFYVVMHNRGYRTAIFIIKMNWNCFGKFNHRG